MQLEPVAVVATLNGGAPDRAVIDGPGRYGLDAVAVEVAQAGSGATVSHTWAVVNRGDRPVSVRGVRLVWRVVDAPAPLRFLQHGWQSWSPTHVTTLGVSADPSRARGSHPWVRDSLHADRGPTGPGELRSEMVTVLGGDGHDPVLAGFDGGEQHDGTFHLVPGGPEPELHAEAFLGGAVLEPGERRSLHGVTVAHGVDHHALLVDWADRQGRNANARVTAPFQLGWCSWYHYFHDVTEKDVRDNLALAGDWPFDVYQVDDGYQAHIGDWLQTADTFPSGVDALASAIAADGFVPGIWLAPFVAHPESEVATLHPEYFARELHQDRPLAGMFHEVWGGVMLGLDTTRADVLDHLERLGADLVSAGYRYLKLDFTFAPTLQGAWSDSSQTPAQRVRAGYDAIRRGAGDDTFILGCGAPLGALVGVVDGMRIGPDVAPSWRPDPDRIMPGYDRSAPAVENAWRSTDVRSFLHRRLWLNDPDCVMLRTTETELTEAQARDWALAVGDSGGMVLVSDDLALLDDDARRLLDEVIARGRSADLEAANALPPRCPDLLTDETPLRLESTQ
jgi:alpha-galactosidase